MLEGAPFDSGDFSFRKDPYEFVVGSQSAVRRDILKNISHVEISSAARFSKTPWCN